MKEIELTNGEIATVDDCDFDYLNQFTWDMYCGYAVRRSPGPNRKLVYMHREVMRLHGIKPGYNRFIDGPDDSGVFNE